VKGTYLRPGCLHPYTYRLTTLLAMLLLTAPPWVLGLLEFRIGPCACDLWCQGSPEAVKAGPRPDVCVRPSVSACLWGEERQRFGRTMQSVGVTVEDS